MQPAELPGDAPHVLFVDDEPTSRKWFAREFGDEFEIATAGSADEALALLHERADEFAVLVTDYRMPERDGMKLLRAVLRDHRHVVRLLVTAYAGKEVAIAAVNQGRVLRILEKPLDGDQTREALREALALYHSEAMQRAVNEGRVAALRETLGFLAHELNTPLATVRGCVNFVADRHLPGADDAASGMATFTEARPGELLEALQRAERRALYCQSLVATFVQSAREAYPSAAAQPTRASALVASLLDEFPFEENERSIVHAETLQDFRLPRRDLLYLVLCTVMKNALLALRGTPRAQLLIEVGVETSDGTTRGCIHMRDNGPGIPPEVLAKLTREPVTTRADSGGNGMGLMFCQRVMTSISGSIDIQSAPQQGTTVTLWFPASEALQPN